MVTLYIENKKDPLINDEAQELICFATVHEVKSGKLSLIYISSLKDKILSKSTFSFRRYWTM